MEVNKSTKEIPIHPNSNNHPSSSSPPQQTPAEKKPSTLDISNQTSDPGPAQNPSPSPSMIRYRECQRNHAAHLGSHVVDGCGEFMPAGEGESTLALKCAACNCHRNFHRREVEGETTTTSIATPTAAPLLPAPPPSVPPPLTTQNCYISFSSKPHKNSNNHHLLPTPPPAAPHLQNHHHHGRAPVMMAFGSGGAAAESSSDDLNVFRGGNLEYCGSGQLVEQYGLSKKRFRTKFSQEQKEKMMEFAEKLGWRIQKQDDVEVQRFCNEVGVKRQVFKVWMHNNKQALKKKQA